ncbi:ac18-like protein [Lambdina fiscellaria nucleopolyhedrovirus]|uniref:Ac18-like protein n=1 Tax=Lambdina fiscellaria nucleopolyhedrovirus TaxID=1642929 RepID=A0A0E3Z5Y4_9ABAC|nr:ac18-like protein [Lambdina fiscellaria nucleopolyhedrovirus]AKC91641.1 ac18-like protein [Lambdina fiscellaria nucleopolyhedrovirus]
MDQLRQQLFCDHSVPYISKKMLNDALGNWAFKALNKEQQSKSKATNTNACTNGDGDKANDNFFKEIYQTTAATLNRMCVLKGDAAVAAQLVGERNNNFGVTHLSLEVNAGSKLQHFGLSDATTRLTDKLKHIVDRQQCSINVILKQMDLKLFMMNLKNKNKLYTDKTIADKTKESHFCTVFKSYENEAIVFAPEFVEFVLDTRQTLKTIWCYDANTDTDNDGNKNTDTDNDGNKNNGNNGNDDNDGIIGQKTQNNFNEFLTQNEFNIFAPRDIGVLAVAEANAAAASRLILRYSLNVHMRPCKQGQVIWLYRSDGTVQRLQYFPFNFYFLDVYVRPLQFTTAPVMRTLFGVNVHVYQLSYVIADEIEGALYNIVYCDRARLNLRLSNLRKLIKIWRGLRWQHDRKSPPILSSNCAPPPPSTPNCPVPLPIHVEDDFFERIVWIAGPPPISIKRIGVLLRQLGPERGVAAVIALHRADRFADVNENKAYTRQVNFPYKVRNPNYYRNCWNEFCFIMNCLVLTPQKQSTFVKI